MAMLTITLSLGAAAFAVADPTIPASQHFQSSWCTRDDASLCSIVQDKTSLLQVQGTIGLASARSATGLKPKLNHAKIDPIKDLSDVTDAEAYDAQAQQMARDAETGFDVRTDNRVKTYLATDDVAEKEARRQTTGDRLETTMTQDAIAEHRAHRLQAAEMAHAARNENMQIAAATEDMDEHVNADTEYAEEHKNADTKETQMMREQADNQAQAQAHGERRSEGQETYMVNHDDGSMGGAYDGHASMSSSGRGMYTSVQQGSPVRPSMDSVVRPSMDSVVPPSMDKSFGMEGMTDIVPGSDPGSGPEADGPSEDSVMD